MRIIYTSKDFAAMPKGDKVTIIKTGGMFEIANPTFWEALSHFKQKFKLKMA